MTATEGTTAHAAGNLSFGGVKARDISTGLERLRQANAQRVKCPACPLMIDPRNLARHVALCHEDEV